MKTVKNGTHYQIIIEGEVVGTVRQYKTKFTKGWFACKNIIDTNNRVQANSKKEAVELFLKTL